MRFRHPPGGRWNHIQAELRGSNSKHRVLCWVGVQAPRLGSVSPYRCPTLESCLFSPVFLKWVWSPHGPAPLFPVLTTMSSVLSCPSVLLTQNASPYFGPFPSPWPSHLCRPHSLDFCYNFQYCNVQNLISILLFLVSFVYISFVQIGKFSKAMTTFATILWPFRALGAVLGTGEIFGFYLLYNYWYSRLEMTGLTDSWSTNCTRPGHGDGPGWRWPGKVSCRKNFLRKDSGEVLGDM